MAVKTSEQLFAALNAGTKWDAGVAFHRTNGLPLDEKSIFPSLSALETYVANDPVAYAGQVVAVVESGASTAYIINDDGTVAEIGSSIDIFNIDAQGRLRINADVLLTSNNTSANPTINKHISVATPTDDKHAANKEYVDTLVSQIPKFSILVVDRLPSEPSTSVVYLLKSADTTESGNMYDEYIYIQNSNYFVTFYSWDETYAEKVSTRSSTEYVALYEPTPFVSGKYYRRNGTAVVYEYIVLSTEPSDWSTNYQNYYEHRPNGKLYDIRGAINASAESPIIINGYDDEDSLVYTYTLSQFYPQGDQPVLPLTVTKNLNKCPYIEVLWDGSDDIPSEGVSVKITFSGEGWEKLGSQQIDISGKMDKFGTYTTTTVSGGTRGVITPDADTLVIENLRINSTPTNPTDPASKSYVDNRVNTILHITDSNTVAEIQNIINSYLALTQDKRDRTLVYYTYTHPTNNRTITIPLSRISVPDTESVSAGRQYRWYFYDLNHADDGTISSGSLYAYVITAIYHAETVQSNAYVDTPSVEWVTLVRNSITNSTTTYDDYVPSIGAVKNYVSSQSIEWQSL